MRGATACRAGKGTFQVRFNPRSPCGERRFWTPRVCSWPSFNPRSPCGERPDCRTRATRATLFQPTLPLRGATHAPPVRFLAIGFQPTLPLRGATILIELQRALACGFNPRSPCGERPGTRTNPSGEVMFQPTLPLRGATACSTAFTGCRRVSTHAPLAGSDRDESAQQYKLVVSTHAPLAGSDSLMGCALRFCPVSTHAPLAGSDKKSPNTIKTYRSFQPTLPLRGATRSPLPRHQRGDVSTHAPLAGSDLRHTHATWLLLVSTHAPLAGSDWTPQSWKWTPTMFQPTLPLRGATRSWLRSMT